MREKPDHKRRQMLYGITLGSGALLALFWVTLFQFEFGNFHLPKDLKNNFKPLALIKANVIDTYKTLTGSASDALKAVQKAEKEPVKQDTNSGAFVLEPEAGKTPDDYATELEHQSWQNPQPKEKVNPLPAE